LKRSVQLFGPDREALEEALGWFETNLSMPCRAFAANATIPSSQGCRSPDWAHGRVAARNGASRPAAFAGMTPPYVAAVADRGPCAIAISRDSDDLTPTAVGDRGYRRPDNLDPFGAPNSKPLKSLETPKRILGWIWRNLARFVGRNQQNQRLKRHDLEKRRPGRFFGTDLCG
jgi:hypothetical protein